MEQYQEIPDWIEEAIQAGLFQIDEAGEIWNTQNFDTALALHLIQWKWQQEKAASWSGKNADKVQET